jgi:hypothetical protein
MLIYTIHPLHAFSAMESSQELRERALQLYEQGAEYVDEANNIVNDLVFADQTVPIAGPLYDDLELVLAGLIHGAWDAREDFYTEAVHSAKMILWDDALYGNPDLMEFMVPDRLIEMGEYAAALRLLERLEIEDEQRAMLLRRQAQLLYATGNVVEALDSAWKAIVHDSSDPISHRVYGEMLYRTKDRVPALMAYAFAIGLEPTTVMVEPMLIEMIQCLNIESMSVGGSSLILGSLGGFLNPEYMFFEMSISMIKQGLSEADANTLYRGIVGAVVDSLCRYSSASLDEPPEKWESHSEQFQFYVPFFASIKRAEVTEAFIDHLYRTTAVSNAPVYDFEDRFCIKSYASGGPLLPESPGWRERDLEEDDDDDEEPPTTSSGSWETAAQRDGRSAPIDPDQGGDSRYLLILIPLALIVWRLCS